ncbi:MAG: putative Holliday junction resolvase [Verrucomicrobiales bacterium]|jgi:putative Holliday junction resolvase
MPRILAIDHGDARVGIALSDELAMLAHPFETIHVGKTEPIPRIVELVSEHAVETIVLGLPLKMDGSEGAAVEKVREFAASLQSKVGEHVRIVEVDERLTTVTAQGILNAAGHKTRETRGVIDQAAAVVILQDYLDSQQGMAMLPPDPDDEEIFG